MAGNGLYDGTRFPVDELDWEGIPFAEDYNVQLQLLLMGYVNRISMRWRVITHETQTPGGCSEQRNLENHNESMRMLMKKYPDFVKPAARRRKGYGDNDFNDGSSRIRVMIYWKKAYEHSQKSTLEDMFA